jgi:hypothetical protein
MIIIGSTLRISAIITQDGVPCNLDGASVNISYKKPSSVTGLWPAIIDSTVSGIVHCDIQASANDERGPWVIWGNVTFSGGTLMNTPGRTMVIYPEGSVLP